MKTTSGLDGPYKIKRSNKLMLVASLGSLIVIVYRIFGEKNQRDGIMEKISNSAIAHKNTVEYKPSALRIPQVKKKNGVVSMLLSWGQMLLQPVITLGLAIHNSLIKGIK